MIRKSPYEILGLEGDFEFKDIKKAYRKAIRENPPEQNPKMFSIISDAYDSLTNEAYFTKNIEDQHFVLELNIVIEEKTKSDNSPYLKKIFEVPFSV